MRQIVFGFALLLAVAGRMESAVYFVDFAAGSDAHPGTDRERPWKHCPGDPAALDVPAKVALSPGDVVRFKGGVLYELTGAAGIRLDWDGTEGAVVTYDGNHDGSWGVGRAIVTDRYGGNRITAFHAVAPRRFLHFRSFDFVALGGAKGLPADTGVVLSERYGGGLAFAAGAEEVSVERCRFDALGYWQNTRPVAAATLTGSGIVAQGRLGLVLRQCEFSRMARALDLTGATAASRVRLEQCTFGPDVVWPVDLPPVAEWESVLALALQETTIPAWSASYTSEGWGGYGPAPLSAELSVAYGEPLAFAVSAIASPAATFRWFRNGVEIPGSVTARLDLGLADAADAGTYTALASNGAGSAVSNSIRVMVTGAVGSGLPSGSDGTAGTGGSAGSAVAPLIVEQPVSRTVAPESNVTFSIYATGSPLPTYQWLRDGVALPGATGPVLALWQVSADQVGAYRVVVTNSAGSVTSEPAMLQLTTPAPTYVGPAISQPPASVIAETGKAVTFSVQASGEPAPTFQWLKNGVALPGATGSVLTLPSVTSADAASYQVVVANVAGSIKSDVATLTVLAPAPVYVAPALLTQPVGVTVAAGASATFTVAASGEPAPTFQWQRDGVPITGATEASFTIPVVSAGDAAAYQVVVSNGAGKVVSAPATLTVTAAPGPVLEPLLSTQMNVRLPYSVVALSFVVPDGPTRRVLIRALGPTLAAVGESDTLADPKLDVYPMAAGVARLTNDNWGGAAELTLAAAQAGAVPFVAADSRDAAVVANLSPGVYVVVATGMNGTTGNVLLEAHYVP